MINALKEMGHTELVNLERLAYILKGLDSVELETLEILSNQDALTTLTQSLKEVEMGKGIPLDEW